MAERREAEPDKNKSELERATESRRILERLEQSGADSMVRRGLTRTASHFAADDAPENDHIEVWATRIGRFIGLLITLAIIGWLLLYLLSNRLHS
ncbi:hypothetical protein AAIB41_16530 [Brucella sp. BE17]|uniref:hypothetical protein n=1 Tax=Brucella sp. BE17 TaxID=3142977 RepID=UPI0031B9C2FC